MTLIVSFLNNREFDYKERGMPDHVIMEITGIRGTKTLQKYKKTNKKTIEQIANRVWG